MKMNKVILITLLVAFLMASNAYAIKTTQKVIVPEDNETMENEYIRITKTETDDVDPLVDLKVTVTIKEIRAFDKIDLFSDPDFYVKILVGDEELLSTVWENQKTITEDWSRTVNVPDNKRYVLINIQLWDSNLGRDTLCDIASNDNGDTDRRDLWLNYSLETGIWDGDDFRYWYYPTPGRLDYSGYGRGNGCDDNSIYENDKDCEIWFDISTNDYDHDGIPYWAEVEYYGTDPEVNDTGRDDDEDGIPYEWEHKWGFNRYYDWHDDEWRIVSLFDPFEYEDQEMIDFDADSINNLEEYLTSELDSDPFRKDVFVELDEMAEGPDGEIASILPEGAKELMKKAFNRQNVVLHIDDGEWSKTGSEIIPFDNVGDNTTYEELFELYNNSFLQGDEDNWKKGVFHYGLVVYNATYPGFCFSSSSFQISAKGMEKKTRLPYPMAGNRDVVYASAYMHELGHTLGLNWLLGHFKEGYYPWQIGWWKSRPYKSIMNYGYMYGTIWNLVDYSDGSRGKNDYDDWSNIDYYNFEF